MLISLLTYLLISNALTMRKDKSILFSRAVMISLPLTALLALNNLTYTSLDKAIGIYGGLFHVTTLTLSFIIFIYITILYYGAPNAFVSLLFNFLDKKKFDLFLTSFKNAIQNISVSSVIFRVLTIICYSVLLYLFAYDYINPHFFLCMRLLIAYLVVQCIAMLIYNYDSESTELKRIADIITKIVVYFVVCCVIVITANYFFDLYENISIMLAGLFIGNGFLLTDKGSLGYILSNFMNQDNLAGRVPQPGGNPGGGNDPNTVISTAEEGSRKRKRSMSESISSREGSSDTTYSDVIKEGDSLKVRNNKLASAIYDAEVRLAGSKGKGLPGDRRTKILDEIFSWSTSNSQSDNLISLRVETLFTERISTFDPNVVSHTPHTLGLSTNEVKEVKTILDSRWELRGGVMTRHTPIYGPVIGMDRLKALRAGKLN